MTVTMDRAGLAAATCKLGEVELELYQGGSGPPLLYLHGGSGLRPDAPFLDALLPALPRGRAGASGLRRIEPAALARLGRRLRAPLSGADRPPQALEASCCRPFDRRLDRGRARDQDHQRDRPAGADRAGRHQGRAGRPARHSRHLRHAAGQARSAALRRAGEMAAGPEQAHRSGPADHGAQPPDARADHLGALHAQSQAQAPAAPHRPADAADPRRAGRTDFQGLRRRLCRPYSRRASL